MAMHRRRLLGLSATALAGIAIPSGIAAQDDTPAAGMVAGGGAIETQLGTVDFGLVATTGADGKVSGRLTLSDFTQPGNPVVMRSSQLSRLETHDPDTLTARQVVGWVSTGAESAIFVLRVDDLGSPGSGKDTFSLHAGTAAAQYLEGEEKSICDCANYAYSLEGPVVRGDIIVDAG